MGTNKARGADGLPRNVLLVIMYMNLILPLTQSLGLQFLYVTLSILLSISFCVAASLFCACIVNANVPAPDAVAAAGECCTPPSSVRRRDCFQEIPVYVVCRPACHDYSLYLIVIVIFHEAVALLQVIY